MQYEVNVSEINGVRANEFVGYYEAESEEAAIAQAREADRAFPGWPDSPMTARPTTVQPGESRENFVVAAMLNDRT